MVARDGIEPPTPAFSGLALLISPVRGKCGSADRADQGREATARCGSVPEEAASELAIFENKIKGLKKNRKSQFKFG
jgi:hypothetical protein